MNNVYLIYGNDYSLIKREIDKLINEVDEVIKYDLLETKVDELLDDASCISLFSEQKALIGDNASFFADTSSKIQHNINYLISYIEDKQHDNRVILTFVGNKLDERNKLVKLFRENCNVIHIEDIEEKSLPKFVINEFKNNEYIIDYKTASYFVSYVGKNIDIIISEINKMIMYKQNDKNITIKDINDICSKGFKDDIFEFLNVIMKKDFKGIFEIYNDLILLGQDEVKILSTIAGQFILVYQCKLLYEDGKSSKEISDILKIHSYRVKLALETDYLVYELEDIIKKLYNLDCEIKRNYGNKKNLLMNFFIKL